MKPQRDARRAELAKIHIARKDLALDDETYKQMLWSVARVESSKDLDAAGRRAVLEHLKARGFKSKKPKTFPGRPHNTDSNPQLKKIEALLADAKRPWSYADAMAKRMFNVDRIAFCNGEQLGKIIAALTIQKTRVARNNETKTHEGVCHET